MLEYGFYNMDCMDGMREFPDKYFDLAIIDPPYGIGEDGSNNHTRGKLATAKDYKPFYGGDKRPPGREYFRELERVSKNRIIFGANHFIEKIPYNSSCWIVWDKNNGANDFADCELAYTSFKSAVRLFRFTWNGMLQENMKEKETRIHPTQKPVALYRWILKNYARGGGQNTRYTRRQRLESHRLRGTGLRLCRLRDRRGILQARPREAGRVQFASEDGAITARKKKRRAKNDKRRSDHNNKNR